MSKKVKVISDFKKEFMVESFNEILNLEPVRVVVNTNEDKNSFVNSMIDFPNYTVILSNEQSIYVLPRRKPFRSFSYEKRMNKQMKEKILNILKKAI